MNFIKYFKFLVIIFLNSNFIISQTSEDCVQTLSIFAEFAKVKNYDSAFSSSGLLTLPVVDSSVSPTTSSSDNSFA